MMPDLQDTDNRGSESRVVICTDDDGIHKQKTHCTRRQEIHNKHRVIPTTKFQHLHNKQQNSHVKQLHHQQKLNVVTVITVQT